MQVLALYSHRILLSLTKLCQNSPPIARTNKVSNPKIFHTLFKHALYRFYRQSFEHSILLLRFWVGVENPECH